MKLQDKIKEPGHHQEGMCPFTSHAISSELTAVSNSSTCAGYRLPLTSHL